jgi:hypothetical protein
MSESQVGWFFVTDTDQPKKESPMKNVVLAVAVGLFSQVAMAHGCPGEMKKIDAKLTSATLSAADATKVKELRAQGEKLHKEGKHTESMQTLGEAKKLLGL